MPPNGELFKYSFTGKTVRIRRSQYVGGLDWCGEWQAANPTTVDDAAVVMARSVLAGDAGAGRALADKLIGLIALPVIDTGR